MIKGTFDPFTGPITAQNGQIVVPKGVTLNGDAEVLDQLVRKGRHRQPEGLTDSMTDSVLDAGEDAGGCGRSSAPASSPSANAPGAAPGALAVQAIDMTKRFPGVVANDHVSFEAAAGEVHALLGENGAGKTTLCNLLMGLYRPDEGKLFIERPPVRFHSPRDAQRRRHLHGPPAPAPRGEHDGRGERGARMVQAATAALFSSYSRKGGRRGSRPLPDARRSEGEDLAALARGAPAGRDPESPLPRRQDPHPRRADHRADAAGSRPALLERARHGRAGQTVIFISHKLPEVLAVADRVTILRQGRSITTVPTAGTDADHLAGLMVGP